MLGRKKQPKTVPRLGLTGYKDGWEQYLAEIRRTFSTKQMHPCLHFGIFSALFGEVIACLMGN